MEIDRNSNQKQVGREKRDMKIERKPREHEKRRIEHESRSGRKIFGEPVFQKSKGKHRKPVFRLIHCGQVWRAVTSLGRVTFRSSLWNEMFFPGPGINWLRGSLT